MPEPSQGAAHPALASYRRFLVLGVFATFPVFLGLAWAGVINPLDRLLFNLLRGEFPLFSATLLGLGFHHGANLPGADHRRRFVFSALTLEVAFGALRWGIDGALLGGMGLGTGVMALAGRVALWLRSEKEERDEHEVLLADMVIFGLFPLYSAPLLELTALVRPQVLDGFLARSDLGYGFEPSRVLARFFRETPGLASFEHGVYVSLLAMVLVVHSVRQRRFPGESGSTLLAFVLVGAVGYALYFVFPVAGPRYVLGGFPDGQGAASLEPRWMLAPPVARNCMPSLHAAWALLLVLRSRGLQVWFRAGAAVFAGLTLLATVGLGYHYLVDLVVSVPFVVTLDALATPARAEERARHRLRLGIGAALVGCWLLLLRHGSSALENHAALTWLLSLGTIAASVFLRRAFVAAMAPELADTRPPLPSPVVSQTGAGVHAALVGTAFVLSGVAGIIYEVVFAKSLALTFGSTSLAQTTVLATYMGGIGLGSLLGARFVSRRSDPLRVYAFCELLIAGWCLLAPVMLSAARDVYVQLAKNSDPSAPGTIALQVLLGAGTLLIPTVLMGATTPALARYFTSMKDELGPRVRLLYGANTLGAGLGAMLTGYALLPALGIQRTLLVAVLANMAAAVFALRLHARTEAVAPEEERPASPGAEPPASLERRRAAMGGLLVLGVGGITSLALEVVFVHLLAVVAGTSAYAFSLMLATFLIALSVGASVGSRLGDDGTLRPVLRLQAALGVVVLGGVFFWDRLPDYFLSFSGYGPAAHFQVREFARAVVCIVAMFPAAFFVGATYPLAMSNVVRGFPSSPVRAFGGASALNTVGNIAGALGAHFVLVPYLGSLRSLYFLGSLCLALAVLPMVLRATRLHLEVGAIAAGGVFLLILGPSQFDLTRLASGANVYFQRQHYGDVFDHAESGDGGLTTVAYSLDVTGRRVLTLLTNGKFQGDDFREVPAQYGIALAPLLHSPQRGSALVIGYGTGASANAIHQAGFERVDVVELAGDVVQLANKHFSTINGLVTQQANVRTIVADGRNVLLLNEQQYDLIGMEISSIWFAGAANLYNREFYALAARRLTQRGVLQQWLQMHRLSPLDIARVLASVRTQFQSVWLYFVASQGVIVACEETCPPSFEGLEALQHLPPFLAALTPFGGTLAGFQRSLILSPDGVDRFLAAAAESEGLADPADLVSTDDNLKLEYSTPRANVRPYTPTLQSNLSFLQSFALPRPAGTR